MDIQFCSICNENPISWRTSNPVAYYMAIDAEIAGDRKPMKEYLKHYAIPTMQRGLVGGTAVRNRRG